MRFQRNVIQFFLALTITIGSGSMLTHPARAGTPEQKEKEKKFKKYIKKTWIPQGFSCVKEKKATEQQKTKAFRVRVASKESQMQLVSKLSAGAASSGEADVEAILAQCDAPSSNQDVAITSPQAAKDNKAGYEKAMDLCGQLRKSRDKGDGKEDTLKGPTRKALEDYEKLIGGTSGAPAQKGEEEEKPRICLQNK